MTTSELVLPEITEAQRVEAWRLAELIGAGYDVHLAELIACRPDVDLHHAIDLLRAGCAPETAVRILL